MDYDFYTTNEDCEKCDCSRVVDISTEYEDHQWECDKGHNIEGQLSCDKKGCGLPEGNYYMTTYTVNK